MPKATKLRVLVGQRVRKLRRRRGLSLEALGERAKVDDKYLQSVETAKQAATVDTLEKLAMGLGVQAAELFAFTDEAASTTKRRIARMLKLAAAGDLRKFAKVLEVLVG